MTDKQPLSINDLCDADRRARDLFVRLFAALTIIDPREVETS